MMIRKKSSAVTDPFFLDGISEMMAIKINRKVTDYRFTVSFSEDSPSMYIHIIAGTATRLREIGMIVPKRWTGEYLAIFPLSAVRNYRALTMQDESVIFATNRDPIAEMVATMLPKYDNHTYRRNAWFEQMIKQLLKIDNIRTIKFIRRHNGATDGIIELRELDINSVPINIWLDNDRKQRGSRIFTIYGPRKTVLNVYFSAVAGEIRDEIAKYLKEIRGVVRQDAAGS